MALGLVQITQAQTTGLATSLTTPSITSTTGNGVFVSIAQGNTSTDPTSVTDSKGNSYAKRKALGDAANGNWAMYTAVYDNLAIGTGGASHTFTINATSTFGLAICAHEVSFAGSLAADVTTSANGGVGGGTAQNPGALVPTGSSNFYLTCITNDNNTSATYTANTGASWTIEANKVGTQVAVPAHASSYFIGTGSQTGTLTASGSSHWVAVGVTYNEVVPTTVALTGTVTASITEADVVAGGKTIILTATNDTFVPAAGFQTIALRGTAKSGNAINGGNVTLTFDGGAGAPQTGDYIVVFGGHGSTVTTLADPGAAAPADGTYTQISVHTGSATVAGAWIKKMGGTPDTQVVCSGGGSASDAVAYGAWVFSGVDQTTPQDATATVANATSTNPNCASITTVTDGAWVLAIASSVVNDATPGTVSGYTNQANSNNTDTSPFTTSGMTKLVSAHGAEDPAAYSSWSSGVWRAITVALRPAATTPFDDARAAIRDGVDSAQAEGTGWDALKTTTMPVANVVRTSSTVVTITLAAAGTYDITAQETITATVPATALVKASPVVATPTFTIDFVGGTGPVGRYYKAIQAINRASTY